jgi:hypothetical protein
MRSLFVALASAVVLSFAPASAARQPHILLMMADDLGWNNVGYHVERQVGVGSGNAADARDRLQADAEVYTPNLDRLVKEGIGELLLQGRDNRK